MAACADQAMLNWDAISAVATAVGTLVALYTGVKAIRAPTADRRRERHLLIETLKNLNTALKPIASDAAYANAENGNAFDMNAYRDNILNALYTVNNARQLLQKAEPLFQIKSFTELKAIHDIKAKLEEVSPTLDRETGVVARNPNLTSNIVAIYLDSAQPAAKNLSEGIEKALETLQKLK